MSSETYFPADQHQQQAFELDIVLCQPLNEIHKKSIYFIPNKIAKAIDTNINQKEKYLYVTIK